MRTLMSTDLVAPKPQADDWRQAMKEAIRDPLELCRRLKLPSTWGERAREANQGFPLFAPLAFVQRIRPGDPRDPLLLQIMPLADELDSVAGFVADPVSDLASRMSPGVVRKYEGRALLITTGACAVHCRYCFRRHYPYSESPTSLEQWLPAIQLLDQDDSIHEVILSGGDPLTLVDELLEPLVRRIAQIRHLRRLRIHTRLPIMIPQRVTDRLLRFLGELSPTVVLVVHANHPRELDADVACALRRIVSARCLVLNQAVLLRDVNDQVETLAELSDRLLDAGVLPYYLHQLDRVAGAAHFEVSIEKGRRLVAELRRRLPGYAVPRYVQDVPGDDCKRALL